MSFRLVGRAMMALVLCGCASEEPLDPPATNEPENAFEFQTGEFTVGTGDQFECFFTDTVTDRELSVYAASGEQGPGGHHLLVYYTTNVRPPTHHPCVEEEMIEFRQVAGVGGEGQEGVLGLHDGMAIRVPAGVQLVVEAHYINTTGAPIQVNDRVKLHLMEPAEVSEYVSYFASFDGKFQIPPNADYTHETFCTVPQDLNVVLQLGHMHEQGRHFKLEIVDDSDATVEVLRDDEWTTAYTSHPPLTTYPLDAPLFLPKGTRLRQTCQWQNSTAEMLEFPREMCVAFAYFFPDTGDIVCPAVAKE